MKEVTLIKGASFTDHRGTLKFVNDFSFPDVKRFYQMLHHDVSVVRAWQGHRVEQKYFYVVKGAFVLAWVKIDDWDKPSPGLKADHVILNEDEPVVLSVPAGYANGIKALIPGSVLMVYSDLTLEESAADRWSFPEDQWFDWQHARL
ncbi:WxcM-like domain-containing protein [Chitinophaga sp. ARDCPP14]|uniref:WxcM-like domain-containing protein n=1 Tax=Chitinophaga sp. ARDCPP14 TaxID=3391139 RepID=UPI003F521F5A